MARPCVMRAIRRNREKLAAACDNGETIVAPPKTARVKSKRSKRAARG